jgi:hypothetical protein
VITFEQTLEQQRDISALCADRQLFTSEIFPPNAYYGNDVAVKAYCGWPLDRPLKVIVPHGVTFDRKYLWDWERQARLPIVLAYPDYRLATYRTRTRKLVLRGTSPFVFLCRMMNPHVAPRSGTLFFPAHSTHHVTVRTDHEAIADRLTSLDSRYHPVRVCVYWRDYLAGRHAPYAARGFEIVSAGHIYDPQFLVRLYHLLSMHRFASSHVRGTCIFQAVHAGCAYFHLDGFGVAHEADSLTGVVGGVNPTDAAAVLTAFPESNDVVTPQQQGIADSFLGSDNIPSAKAMYSILEAAERLDRFGVAYGSSVGGVHFMFPPGPIRSLRNAARRLRSVSMKILF